MDSIIGIPLVTGWPEKLSIRLPARSRSPLAVEGLA